MQVLTAVQGCPSVPRMTSQIQENKVTQVGAGTILAQQPHATHRRQHLLYQSRHEYTPGLSKKNTSVCHTTFKNAQSYGFPPGIYTSFTTSQLRGTVMINGYVHHQAVLHGYTVVIPPLVDYREVALEEDQQEAIFIRGRRKGYPKAQYHKISECWR